SGRLLNTFKIGEALIVVSDFTLLELQDVPPRVRAALDDIPLVHREDVELTEEAVMPAERYIPVGVVVATKRVDAQHIALTTINRVDVLVSWNFKHIVNLQRVHGCNSVNL